AVFLALPLTFPVLISASISRLLEPPAEPEITNPQEDLQELIEVGQQEGLIKESEGELLQSVVEFSDKVVREVMTPRPEIVVIDEYGSVAGLVTIEDLVEEIVGEIRDEVEPHARDIIKESESSYLVAGQTELAQIADQLQVDIEDRDYSTVAGLVLAQLGHVPMPGEKVEKNGLSFEVLEANSRTVLKVRLSVARPASSATTPA